MGALKFGVVSTCSKDGWKQYGSRMVETFTYHWPHDIPFYFFPEEFVPNSARLRHQQFPTWFRAFKHFHRDNTEARGIRKNNGYNFRFDCIRFAHKVAAVSHVALAEPVDVLIWMDADTVTHAPVTHDWLMSLRDPDAYISWLDRKNLYPECGFFMLWLRHPRNQDIMRQWVNLYVSGEVLTLPETHDCYSLQLIIEAAVGNDWIKVQSLSGAKGFETAHPFVNSRLAECLDHLKGPRKQAGRSLATDLRLPRSEAYWQR